MSGVLVWSADTCHCHERRRRVAITDTGNPDLGNSWLTAAARLHQVDRLGWHDTEKFLVCRRGGRGGDHVVRRPNATRQVGSSASMRRSPACARATHDPAGDDHSPWERERWGGGLPGVAFPSPLPLDGTCGCVSLQCHAVGSGFRRPETRNAIDSGTRAPQQRASRLTQSTSVVRSAPPALAVK